MNKTAIAKSYIEYLSKGDLEELQSLFAEDGIVNSPVYGNKNYSKRLQVFLLYNHK